MMCGCGSTGERERATDCAVFVSLAEGPMLHSCILHTLATLVVLLFSVLLYTVCVLLMHFSFQPCSSPSLRLYVSP